MTAKTKQVNFSLGTDMHATWEHTIKDLIRKNIYRNKVEALETYIHFLHQSTYDDVKEFKASTITK